jgi:prepilin-type N-terminal cleavage/methylation domain-containing protein
MLSAHPNAISQFQRSRSERPVSTFRLFDFSTFRRSRAFTLIELIVVVVVITILLGIILPALTSMWRQRNVSTAETSIRGLLATARSNALRRGERGLFFFLDGNVQKIAPIILQPVQPPQTPPQPDDDPAGTTPPIVRDRFRVTDGPIITLPAPLRVCPRNVVDDNDNDPTNEPMGPGFWDNDEMNSEDYRATGVFEPERHRNFFTIVFDREGRVVAGRNVLIQDIDGNGDNKGDRTGLAVAASATQFYPYPVTVPPGPQSFSIPPGATLKWLLVEAGAGGVALNFPGADGLLVYDEDVYREQPSGVDKRTFLRDHGQPYYVTRYGDVIAGTREKF